jgi:hypothetical protein
MSNEVKGLQTLHMIFINSIMNRHLRFSKYFVSIIHDVRNLKDKRSDLDTPIYACSKSLSLHPARWLFEKMLFDGLADKPCIHFLVYVIVRAFIKIENHDFHVCIIG